MNSEICKNKMSTDHFFSQRQKVLDTWSTGRDVESLDSAFAYQHTIKSHKRFSLALHAAEEQSKTLTQPRGGVCLPQEHIKLLKHLQTEGHADLLPTTIDSYTRQNRYREAQQGIEESLRSGRSMLNGFPAVNYGLRPCREITEAVDLPIQVRHGTPDARLLAEITLAGGFTAFEGGAISYNIPYTKNIPLAKSIEWWQYVDRLTGLYAENGIIINREPFGPLTGTLVPPCITNSIAIIETLLAAQQGVVDITIGYGQCGNLYQDIAALRTLKQMCKEYLDRFGYSSVKLTTVFHQWMGGFPPHESKAFGVIAWGAVCAAMAGATKVITKSPHEAYGVPTPEANSQGLLATRQILNMLHDQQPLTSPIIEEESQMLKLETEAILSTVLRIGENDLIEGIIRAFHAGILDIPFAPSTVAHGAVLPVRDNNGAVRILEFGKLPFTEEIKRFHKKMVTQRAETEHRSVSFQMVTDDVYAVSKGCLVGRAQR